MVIVFILMFCIFALAMYDYVAVHDYAAKHRTLILVLFYTALLAAIFFFATHNIPPMHLSF